MTVVVAIEDGDHVYLAADTLAVSGWDKNPRRDAKVFTLGDAVIGYTSSYRMGQIIRFHVDPPDLQDGEDPFEALVRRWIPKVREAFKEHGYLEIEKNAEKGGSFIVGWQGRAFVVESDFQLNESARGFAAVGCGSNYALGALHVSQGETPSDKLLDALNAAAEFSNGVGRPFDFISTADLVLS